VAVGRLSGAHMVSWLTPEVAAQGLSCYTTVEENEVISILDWYRKVYDMEINAKNIKTNSITIQALSDDLVIFPLQKLIYKDRCFGTYVEAGTSHKLIGMGFEGFMVYGAAGQDIRFYMDLY